MNLTFEGDDSLLWLYFSYTRVHTHKISARVFVSAVCMSHAHVWTLGYTCVGHARDTCGLFKFVTVYVYNNIIST